jgi:hypothetical protein
MSKEQDYKIFLRDFNKIYEAKCKKQYMPATLPPQERIVVLGDIHGDFTMLTHLLRKAKVINKSNKWIGGNTIIVQVGDQIDSCRPNKSGDCLNPDYIKNDKAEDLKVLRFMTELHSDAESHGGAVYSLVGNHELMNVDGDMSYVSLENLNEFGGEFGRQMAFKPGGEIAKFVACSRPLSLIIGSNLFVHAGFEPELIKKYNIDDINKLMALYLLDELRNPNIFREDFMIKSNSPLWTRAYSKITNDKCKKILIPLQKTYKVGRIYVGHTPQIENGINSACDGKIWRTDIGISNAFNNVDPTMITTGKKAKYRNGQLLEILNDKTINIIS